MNDKLAIHLLPAFQDNYLFVAECDGSAMVVDPGDPEPIIDFLAQTRLHLKLILVTHHHDDHAGGVNVLRTRFSQAQVMGPSSLSQYEIHCDRTLQKGDRFQFGDRDWQTIAVPGHTLDHLAYYSAPVLFCGDSLFSLGCGRVFEGTFAQSFESLQQFKSLPHETQVYCAHEYTLRNLDFTISYLQQQNSERAIDGGIELYLRLREELAQKRARGEPTVPTTIGFELKHNLFLSARDVEEFTAIRSARNKF